MAENTRPVLVESQHCHLWTDALHARQLARDARNRWDEGTYVRMCITTAWTALETSCQDALERKDIGYSFKQNLDRALKALTLDPLDWSGGLWQKVQTLQELRKSFIHRFLALDDMFPDSTLADDAIHTVRQAIHDVYKRAGKPEPSWLCIDTSRGWDVMPTLTTATIAVSRYGASIDDPDTTKVFIVIDEVEHLTTVLPKAYDCTDIVTHILNNIRVPISAIRVYDCGVLLSDLKLNMRGNR